MPIFVIHVRAHDVEELFLMEPAITVFLEMESHLHNQLDFQMSFKKKQDDLLNQMRNFMQNFHNGPSIPPPGVEQEPTEATKDTKLPSNKDIQPPSVQVQEKEDPPQDSDIRQLIRKECCIEVAEEEKQKMEDTILDLFEICRQKKLLCIHDNVDDLIESALNTKLLSINSNFQSFDKKDECEVTSEDKRECDVLVCENSSTIDVCDNHSEILSDFDNADDISSDDESFEDIEYVDASLPDPEIDSVEEENDVHQEEEEVNLEEVQDVVLREKLVSINRLIANIESLNDNLTPDCVLNSSASIPILEESDYSLSLPEFETFCNHTEETRSGDIHFLEALLIDDPIPFPINESSDNPSIPRPPLEPPDDEFEPEVISAVMKNIDELNEDESFDHGGEIYISTKDEDVNYFPFMLVMRIFIPYLIHPEVSPLFLSAESEDTIFDPGISV
nr:hypothetical protein [Tanacetum cinerariifolium]